MCSGEADDIKTGWTTFRRLTGAVALRWSVPVVVEIDKHVGGHRWRQLMGPSWPSRTQLWQSLRQKLGCGRTLVGYWKTTSGGLWGNSGPPLSISGRGSSAPFPNCQVPTFPSMSSFEATKSGFLHVDEIRSEFLQALDVVEAVSLTHLYSITWNTLDLSVSLRLADNRCLVENGSPLAC